MFYMGVGGLGVTISRPSEVGVCMRLEAGGHHRHVNSDLGITWIY